MSTNPGTVSRILWHFTGGPLWNAAERRQHASPKPSSQAFENLISILRTRELRLGSYQEVVRVRVPKRTVWDSKAKQNRTELNVLEELASSPVCCLADIPIMHLSYLAPRYGKFAIGFHREAIVAHGFNPVFYALENAMVILSIYAGFTGLRYIDVQMVRDGAATWTALTRLKARLTPSKTTSTSREGASKTSLASLRPSLQKSSALFTVRENGVP